MVHPSASSRKSLLLPQTSEFPKTIGGSVGLPRRAGDLGFDVKPVHFVFINKPPVKWCASGIHCFRIQHQGNAGLVLRKRLANTACNW